MYTKLLHRIDMHKALLRPLHQSFALQVSVGAEADVAWHELDHVPGDAAALLDSRFHGSSGISVEVASSSAGSV